VVIDYAVIIRKKMDELAKAKARYAEAKTEENFHRIGWLIGDLHSWGKREPQAYERAKLARQRDQDAQREHDIRAYEASLPQLPLE
jgi:hypothetical protein